MITAYNFSKPGFRISRHARRATLSSSRAWVPMRTLSSILLFMQANRYRAHDISVLQCYTVSIHPSRRLQYDCRLKCLHIYIPSSFLIFLFMRIPTTCLWNAPEVVIMSSQVRGNSARLTQWRKAPEVKYLELDRFFSATFEKNYLFSNKHLYTDMGSNLP